MNYKRIMVVIGIALASCLCKSCSSDNDIESEINPLISFALRYNGSQYHAQINQETRLVKIGGILYGDKVSAVSYQLATGATVTPEPNIYIDKWPAETTFDINVNGKTVVYTVVLTDYIAMHNGDENGNGGTDPGFEEDIPVEGYKLVWSDEFNGTALDMTKWDYRDLGPRRDGINVKENVKLDGEGHLVLTTSKVGDKYHTAMIATQGKFDATYGYFECNAKLQSSVGHWSAFWLQSPVYGQTIGDPGGSGAEIDIFEYLKKDGDKIHHAVHWDGYGDDHKSTSLTHAVSGLQEGWHTFGLLWTDMEYVFFVDGIETWRTNTAISHRSEYIILSLEVGEWAGNIAQAILPDHFYIDYVRVFQQKE